MGAVPYRILIADDDLHTRRILETLLSREPGLRSPEIVSATDGQEALSTLDRFHPDLVITDLLMPRMDGFAFARALRKHPAGGKVPLLVTSAIYKDKVQLAQLESEVGASFYAKPYQLRELVRAVLRILAEPAKPQRPKPEKSPDAPAEKIFERPEVALPQSGSLVTRAVPRLLFEVFDAQSTGVLSLSRARLRKEIFILFGHPIGADSNLRSETLGQLLLARGVVEPNVLAQALELSKSGRDRLGAVLIERGWMKESEVLEFLAAQVRLKIVNALRWQDGDYRFLPGDTFSGRMTHLRVDVPRVVLSGLRRTAHPDEIARAALSAEGRLTLGPRFTRHREAFVRVFGESQLAMLSDRPRPRDIAVRGDAELLVQYEALLLSGLASLGAHGTSNHEPPPDEGAGRREALYQQLFGDEEPTSRRPVAPPTLDLTLDSGVFAMPRPPEDGSGVPQAIPPSPSGAVRIATAAATRDELLREYLSMHSRNHYDRLRAPRDASQDDIARAFAARRNDLRPERFAGMDLGRDHARLEEIHAAIQVSFDTLSDPARRAAYDRTLAPTAPKMPIARSLVEAEECFREGVRLLHTDQPGEAVAALSDAVRAAPEQADYHALLGWALFQSRDHQADLHVAAAPARAALEQAFAVDPDHAGAHEFWGRIGFVLGEDEDAMGHLERALHLDPTRAEALTTLEALCLRTGQHRRLVAQLRSLIARLGEARAAPLWHDLGILLRDHLNDKQGARMALETYTRLVPDDARAKKTLERLSTTSPLPETHDVKKSALALRAAWHAAPDSDEPLRSLFRLHADEARPDAALAAASALVARGTADDEVAAFVRRYRPRFLQRAISQLAWAHVDTMRHPDDDRDLAALFTRLFAAAPPEPAVAAPPASNSPRLGPEALPQPFVQVLGYTSWLLGVAPPLCVRGDDKGAGLRVLHAPDSPALLIASPAALATTDKLSLAFRMARALSALYPARAQALQTPVARLKSYLAAATSLLGSHSIPADDEARALREKLTAFPNLAADVRPIVERLASRTDTINLSKWLRGVTHTAERIGLLICNDLVTAMRILSEEGLPTTDLIEFALSEELQMVRESVGLTIAV